MSEKLVSVVMTAFNVLPYIRKTISSILKQSYKNIEIVIIDDGSIDGTQDILREYSKTGNIKVIFREHTGNIGKNLNDCIKLSKGDVIAIMGADDMWINDKKLEIQMKYLENEKIVCSGGDVIDAEDNIIYSEVGELKNDCYLGLTHLLKYKNSFFASSIVAYKYILEECGLFDEAVGNKSEDFALMLRIASKYKIKYINQVLTSYRMHGNNLSYKNNAFKIEILFRTIELIEPYLKHVDNEIVKSAVDGITYIYAQLVKLYFFESDFEKSKKYCRKLILMYNKKVSFKYIKYLIFFLYILCLDYLRRRADVLLQSELDKRITKLREKEDFFSASKKTCNTAIENTDFKRTAE